MRTTGNGAASLAFEQHGQAETDRRERVLIASGDSSVQQRLRRMLAREYQLISAHDASSTMDLIREQVPDVVIADITVNPVEVVHALRAHQTTEAIPVLFLSAAQGEGVGKDALKAGVDGYLAWPIRPKDVRAHVRATVQLARVRRQAAERERALQIELQALRSREHIILERINDGFLAFDTDWRLTYANTEAHRLLGLPTIEDLSGKTASDVFPADGNTTPHREFLLAMAEARPVEFEYDYQSKNRWFQLKAYPALEGGLSVFFEDITERKRRQRASMLLGATVDSSDDAIISMDLSGIITSWNKSAERLFGYMAEEAIGRSIGILIPPDRLGEETEILACIRRGEALEHFETIRKRKDGALRHTSLTISPVKDASGRIVGASKIARDITEAKRAESAALLLGAIVESSDDAIVSKDLNGIITSWNKGAERVFGYTADEAVGNPITIVIPHDRLDEEPGILGRIRRGERVDHFETVRWRKDRTLLDVSLTISPVRDRQGRIIGASKIARDISERKRAEAFIQDLNAQLTLELFAMTRLQRLSSRLAQAGDIQSHLLEIVDAGRDITGSDMADLQLLEEGELRIAVQRGFDSRFVEFFSAVRPGSAACGMALQQGQRVIVEDVAASPLYNSGALDVMLAAGVQAVQSTPLMNWLGQVVGVFSTHYRSTRRPSDRDLRVLDILARHAADLIERKRAEADLVTSESRFRQLADSMPQIVWTAHAGGEVDYYNERWYEFTGFPRDEFGEAATARILHPDDVERSHETYYSSVRSGEPFRIEYRFWDRKAGRWRWFMGRALPIRDGAGRITKWFGTCTDIDEQKQVEEELRSSNHDLEQFAFSASHDLQEPLRSVKIYSELLVRRYRDKLDGQALDFCNYLEAGASRMEILVRDLLAYTQIGKIELPRENTDTNEVLQETLEDLKLAIAESGAQVTRDVLPALLVHKTHLKQLFQNLIGNAIKYRSTDRAPLIHVSAEKQNSSWLFSVRDNGIGIEPEYGERIFGLFKRLHTGDQYSGTGIGLAICHRIVERYQGRIWVESQPGQGSTFFFSFPV